MIISNDKGLSPQNPSLNTKSPAKPKKKVKTYRRITSEEPDEDSDAESAEGAVEVPVPPAVVKAVKKEYCSNIKFLLMVIVALIPANIYMIYRSIVPEDYVFTWNWNTSDSVSEDAESLGEKLEFAAGMEVENFMMLDREEQAKVLQGAFNNFDDDGTKTIDKNEFEQAWMKLNINGGSPAFMWQTFDSIDVNNDQVISWKEFLTGIFSALDNLQPEYIKENTESLTQKIDEAVGLENVDFMTLEKPEQIKILKVLFKNVDDDDTMTIEKDEFQEAWLQLGIDNGNESEMADVFNFLDVNKDGSITWAEFVPGFYAYLDKMDTKDGEAGSVEMLQGDALPKLSETADEETEKKRM